MPGIVGLLTNRTREWAEPQLLRMVESIRHEPFYTTGTWICEHLGVYVGWVARKGSFCDEMPLCNERGDVTLVFSGQDYPEPGVRQSLKSSGHSFNEGDASYLVHLYEEDPAFPVSLNGRFQGLVVDQARDSATIFNDRYGMNRLYYHRAKDGFYFAAESKAILAVRPELRLFDKRSLGEFVACGCVLQDRTLFSKIHALPAGARWRFRCGQSSCEESYFRPAEWEEQAPLTPTEFYEEIRHRFAGNLPRYFDGHEPVAMTLTGGLDTRLILAWQKPKPGTLPCYTFGGSYRDCQDVKVARTIAELCDQQHTVLRLGEEFLARFEDYATRTAYIAEGGVDVSRASDLFFSERAREIAPAKVVGTYGSEIIRGAVMFKPVSPTPGIYDPEFLASVNEVRNTYDGLRCQHPVTFAAFCQSPWHHFGVVALEELFLTVRCPYLDNDFVRTIYRAPRSNHDEDIRLRLIRDGDVSLSRIRSDRGVAGNEHHLAATAMRGLLEFTFKAEYAYDYGMPQWLARMDHAVSFLHLERMFLGRHKLQHFRIWYKDSLAKFVEQILLDPKTLGRPYLNADGVQRVVRAHLHGDSNFTVDIHRLLTLELLHRKFLEG